MAPAINKTTIVGFALNFLAANFDSATEDNPVTFREEDVRALADGHNAGEERVEPEGAELPDGDTTCTCANCGFTDKHDNLPPAKDMALRLTIGETYTDVECPKCGALCFPEKAQCVDAPEETGPSPLLRVDGKTIPWASEIELCYSGILVPGEDDALGVLDIKATSEGLIMDVWGTRKEHLDTNLGTSSEMAQEIAERLCEENA